LEILSVADESTDLIEWLNNKRGKKLGSLLWEAHSNCLRFQNVKMDFWVSLAPLFCKHLYGFYKILVRSMKIEYINRNDIDAKIAIIKSTPWVNGKTYEGNAPKNSLPPTHKAPIPPQITIDSLILVAQILTLFNSATIDFDITFDDDKLVFFKNVLENVIWIVLQLSDVGVKSFDMPMYQQDNSTFLNPEPFENDAGKYSVVIDYFNIVQARIRSLIWSIIALNIEQPLINFSTRVKSLYPSLLLSNDTIFITTHLTSPAYSPKEYNKMEGLLSSGVIFIKTALNVYPSLENAPDLVKYQTFITLLLLNHYKKLNYLEMATNSGSSVNEMIVGEWMVGFKGTDICLSNGISGDILWKWFL
jgi:hypothetical protein